MATICPSTLLRISQKTKGKADSAKKGLIAEGTITKVETEFFVTFSVKDELGKVNKYYWLTFIDSQTDLPSSYASLEGKSVSITYEAQELFDPRIKEYRQFFVIKKIELVN